ncbi:unnamed protein product [Effrenium voratum]
MEEPPREPGGTLLIWDYDWSLINANSDTYVVEVLRPELMARFSSRTTGWTELMDSQVKELFARGVTRSELEAVVAQVPVLPGCLQAVAVANAAQARQVVLSDANTIFIEAFLKKEGLRRCFSDIISNKAEFDGEGRLHIKPFHAEPPGCALCPSNLCKGQVLRQLLDREGPSRICYVGDGSGDFCPACQLRPEDLLLCRAPPSPPLKRFGLLDRLTDPPSASQVVAKVVKWHTGEDLLAAVRTFLR